MTCGFDQQTWHDQPLSDRSHCGAVYVIFVRPQLSCQWLGGACVAWCAASSTLSARHFGLCEY
eukprot:2626410-Rhodomonas_salina.1